MKQLDLKVAPSVSDLAHGKHTIMVVNPDGQRAIWQGTIDKQAVAPPQDQGSSGDGKDNVGDSS